MFRRRVLLLTCAMAVAFIILIARLLWMQGFCGPQYLQKAHQFLNRPPQWLETVRGTIYDRNGQVLAQDQLQYNLHAHYQLTRLYEQRFWKAMQLKFLRKKQNQQATLQDAQKYIQEQFGPQRQRADRLLSDLAKACDTSFDDLIDEIQAINEQIYTLRLSRARRLWYENNNILDEYKPLSNLTEIENDLAARVPDPDQFLLEIYNEENDVYEMTQSHPILRSIDQETAIDLEQRFVGTFLAEADHQRPLVIRTDKIRVYPYADTACHLIGQLRPARVDPAISRPMNAMPTMEQLAAYYPGDRQGDWAAESLFEDRLRGRRGWIHRDIDRNIIEQIPITPGTDIQLTIDIELQKQIQQLFLHASQETGYIQNGAAVLIDVHTGQILAAVSVPTFDLNTYYQSENFSRINELVAPDPEKLALNRALNRTYQPGSTIKPILLLGALQQKLINAQSQMDCSWANKTWSGYPEDIHNHGPTDCAKALKISCNFFFVTLGMNMGPQRITDWLQKAGFGRNILDWQPEHADQAQTAFREAAGHLSPMGKPDLGSGIELRLLSIGRGPMDATPLQMANAAATIARDGILLHPTLILKPLSLTPTPTQIASPSHASTVSRGMYEVIYAPDDPTDPGDHAGTAYAAFHPLPWNPDKVAIYGKTGSTDYSLFSCFAHANDGRSLALAIVIEAPADGSILAAPLARRILTLCGEMGYLPEPTSEPPEPTGN